MHGSQYSVGDDEAVIVYRYKQYQVPAVFAAECNGWTIIIRPSRHVLIEKQIRGGNVFCHFGGPDANRVSSS